MGMGAVLDGAVQVEPVIASKLLRGSVEILAHSALSMCGMVDDPGLCKEIWVRFFSRVTKKGACVLVCLSDVINTTWCIVHRAEYERCSS